jgi:hypothetical protein
VINIFTKLWAKSLTLAQSGRQLAVTGRRYNRWCITFMDQIIAELQPRVSAQGLTPVKPDSQKDNKVTLIDDSKND